MKRTNKPVPTLDSLSKRDDVFSLSKDSIRRLSLVSEIVGKATIRRNMIISDNMSICCHIVIQDIPDSFKLPTMYLGNFISMLKSFGQNNEITSDSNGTVYIANSENKRQKFDFQPSEAKYIDTDLDEDFSPNFGGDYFTFSLSENDIRDIVTNSKVVNAEWITFELNDKAVDVTCSAAIANGPKFYTSGKYVNSEGSFSKFKIKYSIFSKIDTTIPYTITCCDNGIAIENKDVKISYYVGATSE